MAKLKFKVSLFVVLGLLGAGIFPEYSFAERTTFPNPQGEPGSSAQTAALNIDCVRFLEETLQKLCKDLKLEDLPEIEGLKISDLISFVSAAQGPIAIFTDPEKFKKITKTPEELVQRLGFENLVQLKEVQPGPLLLVKWVRVDQLAEFQEKQDTNEPEKIMEFANKVIVPLFVQNQAKSSITFGLFVEKEIPWKWTRRGAPGRTRQIAKHRNEAQELVEIPGLNLMFLLVPGSNPVNLIPISDVKFENFELKAGVAQPASQIFLGLKLEAKKIAVESRRLRGINRRPPVR